MELLSLLASTDGDIESKINALSIRVVLVASLLLISLILISSKIIARKKHKKLKKPLFIAIASTIVLPSLILTGSTVYINTIADSNGPVHWHADIEFWVCGEEIELRDPYEFLSNKVGTSTYHEHDDKRIHLEGVVVDKEYDASLQKFMKVTGGEITKDSLVIPTEPTIFEDDIDGDKVANNQANVEKMLGKDSEERSILTMRNGMGCNQDGYAELQTFLIRYDKESKTYSQSKLSDPSQYVIRDESTVPPGDCVIVEFDMLKSRTDKLCQQYGIRDETRCVEFGVSSYNPKLCNIRESDVTPFRDAVDKIYEQEAL
jgi:hypothetical protein